MIATYPSASQKHPIRYTGINISVVKCLVLLLGLTSVAAAAERVMSTVRVDARTGKLVRSVMLLPTRVTAAAGPARSAEKRNLTGLHGVIDETARRYEVDPLLVRSIVEVESAYNPYAISSKGAQGLMQLIPSTARRYGVGDAFDVQQNVEGGVKYFRYLKDLFGADHLALAAYNAGEGAVLKYGKVPPYRETEQYVVKVGKRYQDAKARTPRGAVSGSAASTPEPRLRSLRVVTGEDGRVYLLTR